MLYTDINSNIRSNYRGAKIIYILENDLNLDNNSFINILYNKLLTKTNYIMEDNLSENKKYFIRGFFELRGSIDTNRKFVTIDYFYNNLFQLNIARLLIDYFDVPHYILNFNFRE